MQLFFLHIEQLTLLDDTKFFKLFYILKLLVNDEFCKGLHPISSTPALADRYLLLDDFLGGVQPERLFEVLDPGHVDPVLQVGVPLLELDDVVGADVKTAQFLLPDVHDHLQHQTKMLLVLGLPDAETFERVVPDVLRVGAQG